MNDCVFCKIVKGEINCEKIWEDDDFLAFFDVHPVTEGHTLVIPKKHFENIFDIGGDISEKYISALQKVGKILMERYQCEGFNIFLNNGEVAGQVVGHVHFHLFPRKKGDNFKLTFLK